MQGVERYKVRLLPYQSEWVAEFAETKEQISGIWKDNVLEIQHVGSTAIKGILAKPILDIAVLLKSLENMDIDVMKQAGYSYCGAQNEEKGHYLFVLRGENEISLKHIHCYESNSEAFRRQTGFRDYLNNHPDEARQYSELKQELAKIYADDRVAYTAGKEEFIRMIYRKIKNS